MDFVRPQLEIDLIVGRKGPELLADADQLQQRYLPRRSGERRRIKHRPRSSRRAEWSSGGAFLPLPAPKSDVSDLGAGRGEDQQPQTNSGSRCDLAGKRTNASR